jgi:Zn finger protein HypA/HybF involved in hydrogenase expression
MHDLHVADQINKLVIKTALANKLKSVAEINIELGSIVEHGSEINDENLEFDLNALNRGTAAQGAKINIKKIGGNIWRLVSINGE